MFLISFEQQGCIMSAKAERITDCYIHCSFLRHIGVLAGKRLAVNRKCVLNGSLFAG